MARQGSPPQIPLMSPTRRALSLAILSLVALSLPGRRLEAQVAGYPYETGGRDALLAPVGLGLSLLGEHLGGRNGTLSLEEIAALTPERVNAFDRTAARSWSPGWAHASDWSRNVLVGGAALAGFADPLSDSRWEDAATMGAIFVESYLLIRGATYVAKELAGRKRPYVYNDALSAEARHAIATEDDEGAFLSFYSGHAAGAFMAATLLSTVYVDSHGRSTTSDALWGSSLAVAGFTALARVKAGKHFPTDVLVGSAVGAAVGHLVPRLHRVDGGGGAGGNATPLHLAFRIPLGG